MVEPLVEIKEVKVYFPSKSKLYAKSKSVVKAVDDVSFSIRQGETLGLVGESGCGKSTTGRAVMQLLKPTSGEISFAGRKLSSLSVSELRQERKHFQMVFQDPFSSLNPRLTVKEILDEPLKAHRIGSAQERWGRIRHIMEVCGLNHNYASRYAHEFSGGQRQRIGIARALILHPQLVVADEPVSALDVSIQSQILNLMQDLQEEFQLTYLFISHDLGVVRHICDRVGVMYLGRMAELATTEELFANPLHPYTKTLLSAIPVPDPRLRKDRIILQGDVPSPINPPQGCAFSGRCPNVMEICKESRPRMLNVTGEHSVACHLYG
ncbi:dipeptide ABC transporter ATP-binding protein [Brevibacillus choshinensis]|uniref:ABC transporter ATP-binding protein n=1 Tax=Brevibacillus choshinensis TaxID=54911 RepID=UPI002E1A23E6|nr:dipeptide ABC transporter ATP-binding protein [Brevibacillus choshinensis]MED4582653.1 dipeptide ABC transporter ATP-binding protein [Brevibacillus choshinensis]